MLGRKTLGHDADTRLACDRRPRDRDSLCGSETPPCDCGTVEHEKLSSANSADDDDAEGRGGRMASLSYPHSSEAHLNREEGEE